MKIEFLKKEHWHQGDDCTFVKFTNNIGTELFADFETQTRIRVHGVVGTSRGLEEMKGTAERTENGLVLKSTEIHDLGLDLATDWLTVIAEVMFGEKYQAFRKQQMAWRNLEDVIAEMDHLRIWEQKFREEYNESSKRLELSGCHECFALTE